MEHPLRPEDEMKVWTVICEGKLRKIVFRADGTYYLANISEKENQAPKELDWFRLYQPEKGEK